MTMIKPSGRNGSVLSPQEEFERQDEMEIDILGLLLRLVDRWYVLLIASMLCALISGVYSVRFMTPMYQATTKLYVVSSKDSAINLADLQIGNYLASDYQEVFTNWHVHEQVISQLELPYSYKQIERMLTVENPSNTRILYITVTSPSPDEAQQIANAYAQVAKTFIATKMSTEEPVVFEEARRPSAPSSPNKTRNVILGFLVGAFLAAAFVAIQYILDDRVRTADDVEKVLHLPTLGVVPEQRHIDGGRRSKQA